MQFVFARRHDFSNWPMAETPMASHRVCFLRWTCRELVVQLNEASICRSCFERIVHERGAGSVKTLGPRLPPAAATFPRPPGFLLISSTGALSFRLLLDRLLARSLFVDIQVKFVLKRPKGSLQAIELGCMIKPEQAIDLFAVPAESTRKLSSRRVALAEHHVKLHFERYQGWQFHQQAVSAWRIFRGRDRWWNSFAIAHARSDCFFDRTQGRALRFFPCSRRTSPLPEMRGRSRETSRCHQA
jgi:hypothetical protein